MFLTVKNTGKRPLEASVEWKAAKRKNQPFLYYLGQYNGCHVFSVNLNETMSGDYFKPSDVTPYVESEINKIKNMKTVVKLPKQSLYLGNSNPSIQNMVINFFKLHGIPVHKDTTEYDPEYPILKWDGYNLTQSKPSYYNSKKKSLDKFMESFFEEIKTPEPISISSNYEAKIESDGEFVNVGCQRISFEKVKQIYTTMVDQRTKYK